MAYKQVIKTLKKGKENISTSSFQLYYIIVLQKRSK